MSDDKDPQRISDAADNCEVLRARLAKYEDAEGNPISTIAEQAREMVLEELLTRCAEWCDKQPKQPWYGRTAGDMVRTFMACQPLAAAPSACSCGEPDAAGTHRKDGPCYWEPSAPSSGSLGGDV